jgi:hypothetical protein
MATTLRARLSEDDGFVTVPHAIRELGMSRSRVLSLVIRRDLTVKQVAGQLFVAQDSINAYRARHGITGNE